MAQVTQATASVGIILVSRSHGSSLAFGGAAVSAFWAGASIARPVQGRIIDRQGAGRLLVACGVTHTAALAAIAGISQTKGFGWLVILFGALAGLALPPISTSMRASWTQIFPTSERTTCYSLVYLTQELALLAGPLLFAALSAALSASAALVAIAALACVGTLAYAATDLSIQSRARGSAPRRILRSAEFAVLLAAAALVGAVLGALQVGAAALASARGVPALAGLLIAAISVGGILGAIGYGAKYWRATPWDRLVVLLACLATAIALTTVASALILIAAFALLAGVTLNPALSTFSLLIDQHVSTQRVAEAFGWLSTAIAAGTGAGSMLAALIEQTSHDPRGAFMTAAISAAAAAALTLSTGSILRQPSVRAATNARPPGLSLDG